MALALGRRSAEPEARRYVGWRTGLAALAALTLLLGVALSGGFSLPDPSAAASTGGQVDRPSLDGRGKWTGYTR